jgi:hypothetical protein
VVVDRHVILAGAGEHFPRLTRALVPGTVAFAHAGRLEAEMTDAIAVARRLTMNARGIGYSFAAAVLAFTLALGNGCSDDAEPNESRPTVDDLEALFEHLCMLRETCGQSWNENDSVERCTQTNVDVYEDQPTSCLDDVVDYYQCVNRIGDESCARFVQHVPPFECADLHLVAVNSCPDVGF